MVKLESCLKKIILPVLVLNLLDNKIKKYHCFFFLCLLNVLKTVILESPLAIKLFLLNTEATHTIIPNVIFIHSPQSSIC